MLILILLALDLGVFHKKDHVISIKSAMYWTLAWVTLALCFNTGIYFWHGKEKAMEFLAGYAIEKALSVDNIFVFVLIFSYFELPAKYQHKVLFWGIFGTLLMRAAFIFVGIALLEKFHVMIYVFGAMLLYAGYRMLVHERRKITPGKNPVIRLFKRILPVTEKMHNGDFFVLINGKKQGTLLLLVLIVVETTDILFALDSIPAILAITHDRFIVYTSNVFAVLGLRSLYFALAGVMHKFKYLTRGLAVILIFVGLKMILQDVYHIPTGMALLAILLILGTSMAISLNTAKKGKTA